MAVCRERNVAVQTIKSLAKGPWKTKTPTRATWYEPLESQTDIDRAVHWVLGREGLFLNTVGDIDLLPKVLDAATRLASRPSDADMAAMIAQSESTPSFTA